ncbi:MAG: cytotoxin [Thermodesulfobacteriota bacterium]
MAPKAPPFDFFFEPIFLEGYALLSFKEQKAIDKALVYLAANPRHRSLNVHKAKNVMAKYPVGGREVFIAYATMDLRITFEYGPEPGMIALRNCGHHDPTERKM